MRIQAPYAFTHPPLATDRDAILHAARGKVYVLNPTSATPAMVDPRSWTTQNVYPLGPGGLPMDVAVTGPRTAYIARDGNARLQRLDLRTGALADGPDLTPFEDEDGAVHPGRMTFHKNRLYIQVRRPEALGPELGSPHGYIAVVNAGTGRVVDTEPRTPGVQAIALQGTAPRLRMQVVTESKRLYVSATGRFHDAGGLEAIDLTTLRSAGMVIREEDGRVGADLGPFIFTEPDRGFVVFSTDLTLSSHLLPFTLDRGVPQGPERHVSVDYFVPALAHDRRTNTLFLPDGVHGRQGIFAFDARTGARRNQEPIPITGVPSDMLLVPAS
jgi:hypothetical protein